MPAPLTGQIATGALAPACQTLEELAPLLQVAPAVFLRELPGRQTFLWPGSQGKWVVKRFESVDRTGLWIGGRGSPAGSCPARSEFDTLLGLRERGLQVPEPLAWVQRGERSLLIMAHVPHEQTLRDRLADSPAGWRVWRQGLLQIVLGLHMPGPDALAGYHRDLYLQHLLITGQPEHLCLIDVGRVRLEKGVRQRWFEKDLAALAHSAPDSLGLLQRLAWLQAYLTRMQGVLPRPAARKRLLSWARAIQNRQRRMQKHRPRHGESPPGEV